eukprot:Opistho-2@96403
MNESGLAEFSAAFLSHSVDGRSLLNATDATSLAAYGITAAHDVARILGAISVLGRVVNRRSRLFSAGKSYGTASANTVTESVSEVHTNAANEAPLTGEENGIGHTIAEEGEGHNGGDDVEVTAEESGDGQAAFTEESEDFTSDSSDDDDNDDEDDENDVDENGDVDEAATEAASGVESGDHAHGHVIETDLDAGEPSDEQRAELIGSAEDICIATEEEDCEVDGAADESEVVDENTDDGVVVEEGNGDDDARVPCADDPRDTEEEEAESPDHGVTEDAALDDSGTDATGDIDIGADRESEVATGEVEKEATVDPVVDVPPQEAPKKAVKGPPGLAMAFAVKPPPAPIDSSTQQHSTPTPTPTPTTATATVLPHQTSATEMPTIIPRTRSNPAPVPSVVAAPVTPVTTVVRPPVSAPVVPPVIA